MPAWASRAGARGPRHAERAAGGQTGSHPAPPAQVDYFNNATIVELVERPHRGVLAVLDEACSAAGTITDRIFLQSLDTHHRHHPHYTSRQVLLCPPRSPPALYPSWSRGCTLLPTPLPGTVLQVSVGPPLQHCPLHKPPACALTLAPPHPPSSAPQTRPWSLAETSGSSTMQGTSRKALSPS